MIENNENDSTHKSEINATMALHNHWQQWRKDNRTDQQVDMKKQII